MRRTLIAVLLLLAGCSGGDQVVGAEKAVATFHNQLNSANYQAIYSSSAPGMKSATSEADLVKLLEAVHGKLGAYQSGKKTGWSVNYNTAGNNTVVQFESAFEKGKATETFTFVGDSASPRLLGYNINSPTLITG